MSKPINNTIQNKEELEQEIENRLQMIPSSYDRRKFRGLIQRIRTADKKKYDKSISQAHQSGIEEEQNTIIKLRADMAHAIGFCRGLGHPETYLEKNYPELCSKENKNEKNNES